MFLLKKARIYDDHSSHHLKQMDILIDRGVIKDISKSITPPKKARVIKSKNLCVSPGWLDIGTYNGDPGYEYREDLRSLSDAAFQGGYSALAPFPTSHPTIDHIGQLRYLLAQAQDLPITIYPIGALTKGRTGTEMTEILDLHKAGVIAFSDGSQDLLSDAQLERSLLYLSSINGLTIYDATHMGEGVVHEGAVSVHMGLSGTPSYLEENRIITAIQQSEYVDGRILIHNASTTSWLKQWKSSRNRSNVNISVPLLNLTRVDQDVADFNLNLKVAPPLRDKATKKMLIKALESGVINIITSNHSPLSIEEKDQPFGLSELGASTLDTVFPALNTFAEGLSLARMIYALSRGPHEGLGIECPTIGSGNVANITCFDPTIDVMISAGDIKSRSKNNPFVDVPMKGKVLGVVNGSHSTL